LRHLSSFRDSCCIGGLLKALGTAVVELNPYPCEDRFLVEDEPPKFFITLLKPRSGVVYVLSSALSLKENLPDLKSCTVYRALFAAVYDPYQRKTTVVEDALATAIF